MALGSHRGPRSCWLFTASLVQWLSTRYVLNEHRRSRRWGVWFTAQVSGYTGIFFIINNKIYGIFTFDRVHGQLNSGAVGFAAESCKQQCHFCYTINVEIWCQTRTLSAFQHSHILRSLDNTAAEVGLTGRFHRTVLRHQKIVCWTKHDTSHLSLFDVGRTVVLGSPVFQRGFEDSASSFVRTFEFTWLLEPSLAEAAVDTNFQQRSETVKDYWISSAVQSS